MAWIGITLFGNKLASKAKGLWEAARAAVSAARETAERLVDVAVQRASQALARRPAKAFHHTASKSVNDIMNSGLFPGSYATPTAGLSPLQAHIELALNPAKGPRNAILEIDLKGLRAAGFEIPPVTRVTSAFGMPGGGYEMNFPYAIPPEFIRVIQP